MKVVSASRVMTPMSCPLTWLLFLFGDNLCANQSLISSRKENVYFERDTNSSRTFLLSSPPPQPVQLVHRFLLHCLLNSSRTEFGEGREQVRTDAEGKSASIESFASHRFTIYFSVGVLSSRRVPPNATLLEP